MSASAQAQDAFMNVFNSASQAALKSVGGSVTAAPAPTGTASSSAALKTPLNAKAYEFKSSPQVSVQIRKRVMDTLIQAAKQNGKLTPDLEKQLRDGLSKVDIVKAYAPTLEGRGHKMNSVATALSLWLLTNLGMVTGQMDTTPEQEQAVVKQFQEHFSKNAYMLKMTDGDKQQLAEGLMWISTLQMNDFQQAQKGTPGYDLKTTVNQARTLLKGFNFDPDTLAVTEQGLISKGN